MGQVVEVQKVKNTGAEIYLIVVSLTAFAVPAAWHPFDHLLPLTSPARDAAHRGRQGWVACLPAHGLDLGAERSWRIEKKKASSSGRTKHLHACGGLSDTEIGSHLLKLTSRCVDTHFSLYLQKMCLE